jgi:hypothetical protein
MTKALTELQSGFNWVRTNISDIEVIVLRALAIIHLIRHF